MSDPQLSASQIAKIVEAARAGTLDDERSPLGGRERRILSFDFRRTTRFSNEQQARLRALAAGMARSAATALTVEMRTPVSVDVVHVEQTTWSSALEALTPGSLYSAFEALAEHPPLLLCCELPFVLRTIDRSLGGDLSRPPRERTLTELDRRLAGRLFTVLHRVLEAEWREAAHGSLIQGPVNPVTAASVLAGPGDPTLSATLELRMETGSWALTLLLPHITVDAFPGLATRGEDRLAPAREEREALERSLSRAAVAVRAEVATVEMTLDEVLALRVGDQIDFVRLVEKGVTLYVGEKPTHRAVPGKQGRRRAVQVLEPLTEPGDRGGPRPEATGSR